MNTGLLNMGSGFAAARRPGMTQVYAQRPSKRWKICRELTIMPPAIRGFCC